MSPQMPIFNAVQSFSRTPFDGDTSNDILIRVVEFNELGLEVVVIKNGAEASPNEQGLAQWLVSRLGYINETIKTGDEFYVRITLLAARKSDAVTN